MRRHRRVKILATLGPASADKVMLAKLFEAGADIFRINMSHASHDAMRERIRMIRSLELDFGRPIGILVDLQGPKAAGRRIRQRRGRTRQGRDLRVRQRPYPRRHEPRAPAASGDPAGAAAGSQHADRRRQGEAACRPGRAHALRMRGRRRGQGVQPQGRQPPRHRDRHFRHDAEGPLRPRRRPQRGGGLGRRLLRAAGGRRRRV